MSAIFPNAKTVYKSIKTIEKQFGKKEIDKQISLIQNEIKTLRLDIDKIDLIKKFENKKFRDSIGAFMIPLGIFLSSFAFMAPHSTLLESARSVAWVVSVLGFVSLMGYGFCISRLSNALLTMREKMTEEQKNTSDNSLVDAACLSANHPDQNLLRLQEKKQIYSL